MSTGPVVTPLRRKPFGCSPGNAQLYTLVVSIAERCSHRIQRTETGCNLRIGRDARVGCAHSLVITVIGCRIGAIEQVVLQVGHGGLVVLEDSALQVITCALYPVAFERRNAVEFALNTDV